MWHRQRSIPKRRVVPSSFAEYSTPNGDHRTSASRPSPSTEPIVFTSGGPLHVLSIGGISARGPAPRHSLWTWPRGRSTAGAPHPTIDFERFQEDNWVTVLFRHLVLREERLANYGGASGLSSPRASSSNLAHDLQPDPDMFPVSYHALGADITYVILMWVP